MQLLVNVKIGFKVCWWYATKYPRFVNSYANVLLYRLKGTFPTPILRIKITSFIYDRVWVRQLKKGFLAQNILKNEPARLVTDLSNSTSELCRLHIWSRPSVSLKLIIILSILSSFYSSPFLFSGPRLYRSTNSIIEVHTSHHWMPMTTSNSAPFALVWC